MSCLPQGGLRILFSPVYKQRTDFRPFFVCIPTVVILLYFAHTVLFTMSTSGWVVVGSSVVMVKV